MCVLGGLVGVYLTSCHLLRTFITNNIQCLDGPDFRVLFLSLKMLKVTRELQASYYYQGKFSWIFAWHAKDTPKSSLVARS